jgi:hypothetical protein
VIDAHTFDSAQVVYNTLNPSSAMAAWDINVAQIGSPVIINQPAPPEFHQLNRSGSKLGNARLASADRAWGILYLMGPTPTRRSSDVFGRLN